MIPRFGPNAVGFVRTFALIAAITVVAGDLLPEAIEAIGLVAIAVVLAGVLLPGALEAVLERKKKLGLELSYAALVLHHLADGVALSLYADLSVVIALVAHTIPVIAVVVLRFSVERGRKSAIVRAALLGLAIAIGVGLGELVPAETVASFTPWIGALVSGLLLHVITHDLHTDPPDSRRSRVLDFAAAAGGVVLPVFVSHFDHEIAERAAAVALDFAPVLVLAVVLAIFVRPRTKELSLFALAAWTAGRRSLGLDAVLAAFIFLGGAFAGLYFVAAGIGALVLALFARRAGGSVEDHGGDALLAWAIAGALFAAYVGFEPREYGTLDLIGGTAALLAMTAAPVSTRMPLVAVLVQSGFPAGLAFAGLLIDRTAVQKISEHFPRGLRVAVWAAVVGIAGLAGLIATRFSAPAETLRAPLIAAYVCLAFLAIVLAVHVYRESARAYLASLGGAHEHGPD